MTPSPDLCRAAAEKAIEGAQAASSLMLVVASVIVGGAYYLASLALKRADARLLKAGEERERSREGMVKMLDEHRRCSAMMAAALSNPRAKVTVVMRVEPVLESVNTSQLQKDLS